MIQDILDEIVDDEAVAAGEGGDEGIDIGPSAHGQRRQLESGEPALGAYLEPGGLTRRHMDIHHVLEKRRRFFRCQTQVGSTKLAELATRAQSRKWQRRVRARAEDQMQLLR